MLLTTENEKYKLCKKVLFMLPATVAETIENSFPLPDSLADSIKKELMKEISEETVCRELKNVKDLTLELTQDCNLRCKYCTHSGLYEFRRVHRSKMMPIQTAKRAIAFFLKHIDSPYRTRRDPINIGFFGGEPLLGARVLMDSIKYAKELNDGKNELQFMATTNGVLLTKEIVTELVKENFLLDISLDGPEKEHDRFRKTKTGKGSFKTIFNNILFIRDEFPEYFKKKVRFFLTLHPYHDIKKVEDFFISHDDLFNEQNVRSSFVNIDDHLCADKRKLWMSAGRRQYKKLCSQLQQEKWFYKKQFTYSMDELMDKHETRFISATSASSFTGTCFPGGLRLFIDCDGQFHICEKMYGDFLIGNIDDGYNIRAITDIIKQWREEIITRKCWDCDVWHMCKFCFANSSHNERFSIKKKNCLKFIKNIESQLAKYLAIKEKENEQTNCYNSSNMADFLDAL